MTKDDLAHLLLPGDKDWQYYEEKYPERNLKEGAIVSRYAPSPTGLPHMGNLFQNFMASSFVKQTDGVLFLRIEDTDTKRTIDRGIEQILEAIEPFGIEFDEGALSYDEEKGNYGPYIQSKRKDIYWAYARKLIAEGLAYPSFSTKEEDDKIKQEQKRQKKRIGCYGRWAKDRNLSIDEIVKKVENGEKFIIRLKSPGNFDKKIVFNDLIKGKIEMPENDIDEVLIKDDGLPTYHFAHAVDDHLMHTTHVIRSDEWLSSVPKHIQLFTVLGFKVPKFAHLAPLTKNDNGKIRKLSKRHDPEARLTFYSEKGMPKEAVMLYLATITNSNFDGWLTANPDGKIEDFTFDFKKANSSNGTLFDLDKMENISRNYISRLSAKDVYNRTVEYYKKYDNDFALILEKNKDYSINVLNIERVQKKPRKDIAYYSDVKDINWYMFDELFTDVKYNWENLDKNEIKNILNGYMNYYNSDDDKDTWFNKIKDFCNELGYTTNMKEYRANPDNFKGSIVEVTMAIRIALTSLSKTPDLYQIMKLLGADRINKRFDIALQSL